MSDKGDSILAELRAFGLTYPGAHSKSPWPDHDDLAVNDKTFAYLPKAGEPFSLSVKLPYTSEVALDLPYARPTAYGLGKSGWVSFSPAEGDIPSIDQLKEWLDESYRAQAPKKLVRELDARDDLSLSPSGDRAGRGGKRSALIAAPSLPPRSRTTAAAPHGRRPAR